MDSLEAFALGQANRDKELMVFDWEKAAKLIKQKGEKNASAGLRNDWEWTGGMIFTNGKPDMDDYTYLASTWAIPELEINGEIFECYKMQSDRPGWDSDTKWPKTALRILGKET
jgi:hypothetical protein